MATRIWGGIAGWFLGVAPLLAVNAIDYFGIYYFPNPFLVGSIAILAGLLLGGIVAGVIGSRSTTTGGGAIGAATTGIVAAALYAVSVIGLMEAARSFDALPLAVSEHPIRISLGILFIAALLLLVALITGVLAGKPAKENSAFRAQPARPLAGPSAPRAAQSSGAASGIPPYAQPRYGEPAPPSRPASPRSTDPRRQSPDAFDPRYDPHYAGARAFGTPSRPARRPQTDPNRQ